MKRFLISIGLFCLPFLILLIPYLITDPFKVLYHYDMYYKDKKPLGVILNRDYISTSTFRNFYPQEKFDSYILGNSRSGFYEVADWQTHIGQDTKPFHFDASNETLYGIYKKILYIDNKASIKNALIVLDYSTLSQIEPINTHIFYISPELENNKNIVGFHVASIRAFFTSEFLIPYFNYKTTGVMSSPLDERPVYYEHASNEIKFTSLEKEITEGTFYTPEKVTTIFKRKDYTDSVSVPVIKETQYEMLSKIKEVFDRQHTNYKIIINPLYDQIKLNPKDIEILSTIFDNKVYDFSGKNRITDDYHNYYEASHYRPHVAAEIMRIIYEKDQVYQSFLLDSIFEGVHPKVNL